MRFSRLLVAILVFGLALFFGATQVASATDFDADGFLAEIDDCNDFDATIYPGAPETVGDGVDQNCDSVDDCYFDGDGDTFGTSTVISGSDLSCANAGESTVSTDCEDFNASINPAATEIVADGKDQNCDLVDDCYADADGDGFGGQAVISGSDLSCANFGESIGSSDCADFDPGINPGAPETVADGVDQDCDSVDDCYFDLDGDTFGVLTVITGTDLSCANFGESIFSNDCNDTDASIFPGATETVADLIDQNCDLVDDCYADADFDFFGGIAVITGSDLTCTNIGESAVSTDCNDGDPLINPAAIEIPNNGVDEDCNPATLDADLDGDGQEDGVDACPTTFTLWLTPIGDGDCDGFTTADENFYGTDPLSACAADGIPNNEPGPDKWPVDLNDTGVVTTADVGFFIVPLNSFAPGPPYSVRLDFNKDGLITTADVGFFIAPLNQTCPI